MKKIFLLLITAFTLSCCYNDDSSAKPKTELDKLPPATQIGANTIGCLLDGKAFKPGYYNNSTNCFYQYVDGGYYFHISFNNEDSDNKFRSLAINTNKLSIAQGKTLVLNKGDVGSASGYYQYEYYPTYTDSINTGELKITKLDSISGIVSGTFWYDIIDYEGVKHEIREGRFDMHYTN